MDSLRLALRTAPSRMARVVTAVGLALIVLLGVQSAPPGLASIYSDAWVYLAAGERLNAGHDLYALGPGDRNVMLNEIDTMPLLSPPPVAVLWRPLALLGEPAMALWCAGAILASLALVGWAVAYGGWGSLIAVIVLGPPLFYAALPGNANAYLAPLLALAWRHRHRGWLPATAVVAATAIKITPVAMVPWLLYGRRLLWAGGIAVGILAATVVGAPGAIGTWLANSGVPLPSPTSIAGMLGVNPRMTTIVIVAASWITGIALRRHERAVFVIGLVAATVATPAFYFHTLALLAPLMAIGERAPALEAATPVPSQA